MPGLEYNDEDDMVPIPPLHNLINEIEDEFIANVFCFGVFAGKVSGVVYNDCTGDFPYMSLDGNVCFFVMYHYETNAILITPIAGLDSERILEAYKKNFEYLVSKGFNSLTAIRVLAGTKNSRPVGFYSRNSTKSTANPNTTIHKHHHHGGAVRPSFGVRSMDPPNWTRRPSSEGVGRGGG
jgi:hypothetical protein